MKFGVKRLTKTAKLPTKAHDTDSGWDLYADSFEVNGYGTLLVHTGIAIVLPDSHDARIEDKSGIGSRDTYVLGGVIDQTYVGELVVMLGNHGCSIIDEYNGICDWKHGDAFPYFHIGDKVAQLTIHEKPHDIMYEVFDLPETERGDKGFGSSGR